MSSPISPTEVNWSSRREARVAGCVASQSVVEGAAERSASEAAAEVVISAAEAVSSGVETMSSGVEIVSSGEEIVSSGVEIVSCAT